MSMSNRMFGLCVAGALILPVAYVVGGKPAAPPSPQQIAADNAERADLCRQYTAASEYLYGNGSPTKCDWPLETFRKEVKYRQGQQRKMQGIISGDDNSCDASCITANKGAAEARAYGRDFR